MQAVFSLANPLKKDSLRSTRGDSVHILHVHAAKGLEFPFVIITGVTGDKYPHKAALSNAQDDEQKAEVMEKARRLLYVALSRAARSLWMVTGPASTMPIAGEPKPRRLGCSGR